MTSDYKPLLLLASLLFAACQGGGSGSPDGIRALSNGPDLPEECDICWVDFEACANSGIDFELCEDAVIACALVCEAPPPPIQCDHCFAGYQACVEQAESGMQDVGDCVSGLEACLVSCELPEPCFDGSEGCPPPPCDFDPATGGMECPPIPCELNPDGSTTCPPPPWGECEDICTQQCYFDEPSGDGSSSPPYNPGCFEECMDQCSVDPVPCYEVCWDCAADDPNCEPGCGTVCEPEPQPCYGGCDVACDSEGNCQEFCWEECPGTSGTGSSGEVDPVPAN